MSTSAGRDRSGVGLRRVSPEASDGSDGPDDGGLSDGWAAPVTAATFVVIPAVAFGAPAAYEYNRSGDVLRAGGAGLAGMVAVAVTGRTVDYLQNR